MAQFILGAVKADQNPAFVEIGRLGRRPGVDQHGGGVDTVSFDANAVDPVAKTGEHLATDLPAIKLCGRISGSCTGMGGAELIDEGA